MNIFALHIILKLTLSLTSNFDINIDSCNQCSLIYNAQFLSRTVLKFLI